MKKHHYNPDDCTACTSCVIHCPVAQAVREFQGPKLAGPAGERFRLMEDDWETALEYCSNCKNCDISCPSRVPISTLTMKARAQYYKTHKQSFRDWLLSHGEQMGKMASLTPTLANLGMNNIVSKAILKNVGISDKAPLPAYASESFSKQFKKIKQQPTANKAVFYPGCFINYNQPQVGLDVVAVLQVNNFEVIVPEEAVCCGSPLVVNGYMDEAEANAHKNIAILQDYVRKGYPIITACTSCGLMLKQEYQELFASKGVEQVAGRIYDISEFLLELYDEGLLNTNFARQEGRYLYHAPCHLRVQGIGKPSLELVRMIPAIEVIDADAGCCGISGNYGFKAEKYDIAMAVGNNLFETIKASGIGSVLSECGTCRLQIAHGTGVKTEHPIAVVRSAYNQK
ncbi:Anaerobic glycerol-3-phosphate dehydrogenase subunit C [Sporomusa silvacetica DSM 10669]|uniref:Anaerobic glycerol-3-phosphate dehydrogenase subunit C n=1 Tax=Sporomusa silvacetica DSM 10669 TaxID=1123289 RepID=A0ABZ3IQF6_9FIRM|nr:anaerobic glycerol-3-phosphate dehydrogenase subunit C [Sporomusa silvacetica]OZC20426.1 anaerobic glycerol-3-phosphate dehydrogenase subunit C [Sporomusa silvacetica DSM 10669]